MADLYGREWALTVGNRQWTDLRVVFEVKRTLNKHPDPATVTIYNLAAATRASFKQGDQLRLVAGYRDASSLLYSGQVMDQIVARDGPDWATTFTVRDGDTAWRTLVNTAFATSAPLATAVTNIASAMGLVLLPTSGQALAGLSVRGGSVHLGPGHDALTKMLTPWGLRWCVQDGNLVILPLDGTTYENAVLLTPTTGLVGSPEPMTDQQRKRKTKAGQPAVSLAKRIRITSLLQPSLTPGRRVVLQSTAYDGVYRVDAAVHRGDSRGQDWYSVVECTQLSPGAA